MLMSGSVLEEVRKLGHFIRKLLKIFKTEDFYKLFSVHISYLLYFVVLLILIQEDILLRLFRPKKRPTLIGMSISLLIVTFYHRIHSNIIKNVSSMILLAFRFHKSFLSLILGLFLSLNNDPQQI